MDRDALVLRNQTMAQAFHKMPPQHHIRRAMLHAIARLPISKNKTSDKQRILLIRPDHLGDTLLTTPAIVALKRALPDAELHVLVGAWSATVLANYPEIDTVLTLPFPGFDRSGKQNLRSPYQLAINTARNLRKIGYTSAIIFRPDHWWGAMVAHLAGIPKRIGYDLIDTKPFLTDAIPFKHQHAILQNLNLIEGWTGQLTQSEITYQYQVDDKDRAYIRGYLAEWGINDTQKILCIHAGSGTWVKQWSPERWATVADMLYDQMGITSVFSGGEHEMTLVKTIVNQMKSPACITVGETQIQQLGALFERAQVVLGPDSGPLHLAAAVNTPTITLFGPADPIEFRAWGDKNRHIILTSNIACRPCKVLDWGNDDPEYHPCMRDITVGQVLEATRRILNSLGNH